MDILLSFILTLAIIFTVPVLVYGLFASLLGLKEPEKKLSFFAGVLLQKIGTAAGFVALFYIGRGHFLDGWLLYGLIWFAMFAVTEVGETLMSQYSKKEAAAGIISEAIYFPLAAFIISKLF